MFPPEHPVPEFLCFLSSRFKAAYPGLNYHITSGDTEQVTEKLDKGLLDFGVICSEIPDARKYNYITFPRTDKWGAVMSVSHPLARKKPS